MSAGANIGPTVTDDNATKAKNPPVAAGASARSSGSLAGQWNDWLSDPSNRSMLISFGASLMQPPSAGQSAAGQFGQAAATGLEAKDRQQLQTQQYAKTQQELALAPEKQQAEIGLANAQADYYRTRGATDLTTAKTTQAIANAQSKKSAVLQAAINGIQRDLQNAALDPNVTPEQIAEAQQRLHLFQQMQQQALIEENAALPSAKTGGAASAAPGAGAPEPPIVGQARAALNVPGANKANILLKLRNAGIDPTKYGLE